MRYLKLQIYTIKNTVYEFILFKKSQSLSDKRKKELNSLIKLFQTLGKTYRLKELFNDLWEIETEEEVTAFLVEWCQEVEMAGIEPFKEFTKTIKSHWAGIVNFCETQINNGI